MNREERRARIAALEAELVQLRREEVEADRADDGVLVDDCVRIARAGRLVEAVKLYRSRKGCSLLEAKYAVEGFLLRVDGETR